MIVACRRRSWSRSRRGPRSGSRQARTVRASTAIGSGFSNRACSINNVSPPRPAPERRRAGCQQSGRTVPPAGALCSRRHCRSDLREPGGTAARTSSGAGQGPRPPGPAGRPPPSDPQPLRQQHRRGRIAQLDRHPTLSTSAITACVTAARCRYRSPTRPPAPATRHRTVRPCRQRRAPAARRAGRAQVQPVTEDCRTRVLFLQTDQSANRNPQAQHASLFKRVGTHPYIRQPRLRSPNSTKTQTSSGRPDHKRRVAKSPWKARPFRHAEWPPARGESR